MQSTTETSQFEAYCVFSLYILVYSLSSVCAVRERWGCVLRPAYTGRLPADLSHATPMNMDKCSANHQ